MKIFPQGTEVNMILKIITRKKPYRKSRKQCQKFKKRKEKKEKEATSKYRAHYSRLYFKNNKDTKQKNRLW